MSGVNSLEEVEQRTAHLLEALSPAIGCIPAYPPPPFRFSGMRDLPPSDPVMMRAVREHRRYAGTLLGFLTSDCAAHDIRRNFSAHAELEPSKGGIRDLIPGMARTPTPLTPGEVTLGSFGALARLPGSSIPVPARVFTTSRAVIVRPRLGRPLRLELSRVEAVSREGSSAVAVSISPGEETLRLGTLANADALAALVDELVVLVRGRRGASEQRRHSADLDDDGENNNDNNHNGSSGAPSSGGAGAGGEEEEEEEENGVASGGGGGVNVARRDSHGASDSHGPGKVLTAEAYENQRLYPFPVGWSSRLLPGERPSWSTRCGSMGRPIVDTHGADAPSGWVWVEAWHVEPRPDEVGTSAGGDPDGWVYASSFGQKDNWSSQERWGDVVRRRRWARLCVRT